jgi:hypothetical protein
VPRRARLAAVAVLTERESRPTALQRLALVDAASWWLSEQHGGQQLAQALLEAACTDGRLLGHWEAGSADRGATPPSDRWLAVRRRSQLGRWEVHLARAMKHRSTSTRLVAPAAASSTRMELA